MAIQTVFFGGCFLVSHKSTNFLLLLIWIVALQTAAPHTTLRAMQYNCLMNSELWMFPSLSFTLPLPSFAVEAPQSKLMNYQLILWTQIALKKADTSVCILKSKLDSYYIVMRECAINNHQIAIARRDLSTIPYVLSHQMQSSQSNYADTTRYDALRPRFCVVWS
jgi:hypothetical protein